MASENLKRYIWETQIVPQLGYSFSDIHSTGYSLIALQMMNLEHRYPSIFWSTSCLSISAGADEDSEHNKSTNYGKVAWAISKMQKNNVDVALPLINKADFGFTPDVENNRIIFGLKGIVGVNDDLVREIIKLRPYSSFEDFYQRLYTTKIVTKGQFIKLIKAGCFNEFDSQQEIMKQFLVKEVDTKDKLNGQNLPRIISLGLLDTPELIKFKHFYNFKSHISKKVHKKTEKPKDKILILDSHAHAFFEQNFSDESIVDWHENKPLVSEKKFKKEYDVKMSDLTAMLSDSEFVRSFNIAQFYELWNELAQGTESKWQMDSVSFYHSDHELSHVDRARYNIANFFDLSEDPIVLSENTGKNGRVYKNVELYTIVGTILDKDKNKHSITVLTPDGVVTCKTYSGAFSHYDKQISTKVNGKKTVLEKSWLSRGELVLINGFRRQDTFVLKANYGEHTINKITAIHEDGTLSLQIDRVRV